MKCSSTLLTGALLIAACSADSDTGATGQPTAGGAGGNDSIEALTCWAAAASGDGGEVTFTDVTADAGLTAPLTGMHGHAAAWGDVDSDGLPDLFVGTFADRPEESYRMRGATGPAPDTLLHATTDSFRPAEFPDVYGRTSGAAFADLDGDADLDLVVSRNPRDGERQEPPTTVYANDGSGAFEPVDDAGLDPSIGGRSVGVLDFDGDQLLDLFVVEDIYEGGSSRLYRNLGDLRFDDATEEAGLPDDIHGLGAATGDVNRDGWPDLFVGGSNRLFAGGDGTFREVGPGAFAWETYGDEDLVAGAAFGDVNRDGWPDLVVGHHYNSTLDQGREVPVRLYLNRTHASGDPPEFDDVTDEAGLAGLPTKAPDISVVDLDNDGWPDILTTASAGAGNAPAVFQHTGELVDGVPRFAAPSGLGDPQYWISGPVADADRDGRMDVLLVEWEPARPSLLLHNTSHAGHWISVSVAPGDGTGVGTRVSAFEAGGAGDRDALVASDEIVASSGYTSGTELMVHLGLGSRTTVDLELTTSDGDRTVLRDVPADRHLRLPDGC